MILVEPSFNAIEWFTDVFKHRIREKFRGFSTDSNTWKRVFFEGYRIKAIHRFRKGEVSWKFSRLETTREKWEKREKS